MTDNEIIKVLEEYLQKCQNIKYGARKKFLVDADFLKEILDLIKRKDAKIERLNVELVGMRGAAESYKIHYDNSQAEIERLQIRNKTLSAITRNYDWNFAKVKSEAIKATILEIDNRLSHYGKCDELHKYEVSDVLVEVEEAMVGEKDV